MSTKTTLPKTIPSKELSFSIKITGSTTAHQYEGDFIVKVPSVRDMSKIGVFLAKLNCGVPFEDLDRSTASLNNAIAFLQACLIEAPKWFTNAEDSDKDPGMAYGLDTLDVNVPVDIFSKANALVQDWHNALKGAQDDKAK